jgi:hypothetical protein
MDDPDFLALPVSVESQRFGRREATLVSVELKAGAEPEACWIESLERGWLFLITCEVGRGWLLAVGNSEEELLGASRLVARQIANHGTVAGRFPASPRIATPLAGDGWLACGSAAMAFDPLCGDGTSHAVREAVLACAVIGAVAEGTAADGVLAHYQMRLTAGFQRHLGHCLAYYGPGHTDPWWGAELDALREGMARCEAAMKGHDGFRYRLNGLKLEAIDP